MATKKRATKAPSTRGSGPKAIVSDSDRLHRYQAVDENMALIEFDLEGTIVAVNELFLRVMGFERAELLGQKHRLFVDADYAASDAYRKFWADLRAGHTQSGEYRRLGRGGARGVPAGCLRAAP